nr:ring assembly protein 3 [Quercus suber]
MSSESKDHRISTLLDVAQDLEKAGKAQQAANALKEALNLDPRNAEAKARWLALQGSEASGSITDLMKAFASSTSDVDAQKVKECLQQKQISYEEATEVVNLLEHVEGDCMRKDELTACLLNQQLEAKRFVVSRLVADATGLFTSLFSRGDDTVRELTSLPLNDSLWTDRQLQVAAQQDMFRLCEATLMDSGVEHPERALRAMAKQLAVAPENVVPLIDADAFEVILTSLDIRLDVAVRSQATLATAKMLEAAKEEGESLFASFVTTRVGRQTNDDLIIAFSAAAAVFPIIPVVAAQLFMTEGFVQQLVPNLEKNSEAAAAGKRTLEQAALELLSAACVEKNCRGAINQHCSPWLKALSEERESNNKALAALILAKIDATSDEEISKMLSDMVLHGGDATDQAVEGLAYTTLRPKVKETVIHDASLVKKLVEALKSRTSASFGCLTIFANLTAYRVKQTEEQKKMAQLKAYANQSKPVPDDPLDNDGFVTARCRHLLDQDLISATLAVCKQTTSPTIVALVVGIHLAIAKEQKHRVKMTQQGAIKLLLQIRDRMAKSDKVTSEASVIERNAAHALARLLISVNPAHVFSSNLPTSSAVSTLVPLLSPDHDSEQRDLLPTFEALLALTNLASMDDDTTRNMLVRKAWEKIEDLLFSPNTLVQRAAVELLCNLMSSPDCVTKFADGSKDAQRRVTILLALADVEDMATRRAAGGALAMLTEWDAAVIAVLNARDGKGVEILIDMCKDDNDDIKHRAFVSVSNVVSAPGKGGIVGVEKVRAADGLVAIREALKQTRNSEVLRLGVEILKKLM